MIQVGRLHRYQSVSFLAVPLSGLAPMSIRLDIQLLYFILFLSLCKSNRKNIDKKN